MIRYSLSEKITHSLVRNGVINFADRELYLYGFRQGLIIILNVITIVLIGSILDMVWQSILVMMAYIPVRSNAGGYHAKTQLRCYLFSTIVLVILLLAMKSVHLTNVNCLFGTFISGTIIYFFSPVEDCNKPLNQTEVNVYKKRTRRMLSVEILLLFGNYSVVRF